ncbi:RING finger protein 11-like [Dysidea avara]|uniref:RING finger protein 11-like n=1 Tax=Dysidea avara TaxID=196820 RepID=UPI0033194701
MGNHCNCVGRPSVDDEPLLPGYAERDGVSRRGPPPPYEIHLPVFQSEEARLHLLQRLSLLQSLPIARYTPTKSPTGKGGECPICMMDFAIGEPIRLLPCMHFYHVECIDDWLLRSIYCPTCMESVDSGVVASLRTRSRSSSQSTTPPSSGQQTPICIPSTPLTPPLSPAFPLR